MLIFIVSDTIELLFKSFITLFECRTTAHSLMNDSLSVFQIITLDYHSVYSVFSYAGPGKIDRITSD